MTFERFYRFDFAVTQIFTDPELTNKYHGIAISAHLLSYTPTSVIQLLSQTRKPFFIDPMTFVFGRDIGNICRNGAIRRSYKKLMEDYGLPFSSCSSGVRLTPRIFKKQDFSDNDELMIATCKRILDFQKEKFKISEQTSGLKKYAKILKKGAIDTSIKPKFLLPPYFYANDRTSEWYALNLKLAKISYSIKGDLALYPVICISKDILWDNRQILEIVKDYAGYDGYIIWVNNLDEEKVDSVLLKGLKTLVNGLSGYGKPVYSLYGGFMCDLLAKFGLSGYSSGICYGESRSVDAKGGGAGNRYYVPTVHVKVSEDWANAFFAESEKNKRLICTCPTCSQTNEKCPPNLPTQLYADAFFENTDFLDFRRHFVNVKFDEMRIIANSDNVTVAAMLDRDIQAITDIDRLPEEHPTELTPNHLRVWRTLFE